MYNVYCLHFSLTNCVYACMCGLPCRLCLLQEENGTRSNGDSTVMQNGGGGGGGERVNGTGSHDQEEEEEGSEEHVEGLYKVSGLIMFVEWNRTRFVSVL